LIHIYANPHNSPIPFGTGKIIFNQYSACLSVTPIEVIRPFDANILGADLRYKLLAADGNKGAESVGICKKMGDWAQNKAQMDVFAWLAAPCPTPLPPTCMLCMCKPSLPVSSQSFMNLLHGIVVGTVYNVKNIK
jgi:hypothetical protein